MPLTSIRSGNPTAVVAMQALLGSLRYAQLLPRSLGSAADAPHFRAFAAASAQLTAIKALRERTSAPISDVKSALVEASWNEEEAYQALRKKGIAAASKKASRHAAEGLIGIARAPGMAAIVEVNSETDFATKTDQFRDMVSVVAAAALRAHANEVGVIDRGDLQMSTSSAGASVEAAISDCAGGIRENIQLRRAQKLVCQSGVIGSYLHASPSPGLGKMGALVALTDKGGSILEGAVANKAQELGSKLAMHVVAARPLCLDKQSVPEEAIAAERYILREQALKLGKPANIVDRMVSGRLHKFYEDSCLLEQKYVMDELRRVGQVVKDAGKELGLPELAIAGFVRFQCGEGLEREQASFVEEVAQTLQSTG